MEVRKPRVANGGEASAARTAARESICNVSLAVRTEVEVSNLGDWMLYSLDVESCSGNEDGTHHYPIRTSVSMQMHDQHRISAIYKKFIKSTKLQLNSKRKSVRPSRIGEQTVGFYTAHTPTQRPQWPPAILSLASHNA